MLYLTTRSKTDSYTAHRVLHSEQAPGGGYFMPFQMPELSQEDLFGLKDLSFNESIAKILNLFFGTKISGWDVDFAIGRQGVKFIIMSHRIYIAETWHNPDGTHEHLVRRLYKLLCGTEQTLTKPGVWFYTAVDIAVLFAVYGQLLRADILQFDAAFKAGDLQSLVALRIAQRMGLPVRTTVLGAEENDDLWEFIYHGDYSTKRDVLPAGLEQLIYLLFGTDEVKRYLQIAENRKIYQLDKNALDAFSDGLFVSVVGVNRADNVIYNVKRNCSYSIGRETACAYGALQDYRVRAPGSLDAVLFSHYRS